MSNFNMLKIIFLLALFGTSLVLADTEKPDPYPDAQKLTPQQHFELSLTKESKYQILKLDQDSWDNVDRYKIRGSLSGGAKIYICFVKQNKRSSKCLTYSEDFTIAHLGSQANTPYLSVTPKSKSGSVRLDLRKETGDVVSESEPNDLLHDASAISARVPFTGNLDKNDTDHARLETKGDPQLWRIQVLGKELAHLTYYDSAGNKKSYRAAGNDKGRLRLENLLLGPGEHYFGIRGDGDYTLRAIPLGSPPTDLENEPNDQEDQANTIYFGEKERGVLPSTSDVDIYQFSLQAPQYVHIRFTPPSDGEMHMKVFRLRQQVSRLFARELGGVKDYKAYLPAGHYTLRFWAKTPSEAEYTVSLNRLDLFPELREFEPNDTYYQATNVPRAAVVDMQADIYADDPDYYYVPAANEAQRLKLTLTGDVSLSRQYGGDRKKLALLKKESESNVWTGEIPANQDLFLGLWSVYSGENEYSLKFEFEGASPLPRAESIALNVSENTASFAAYIDGKQSLKRLLKVSNTGTEEKSLKLQARATLSEVQVEFSESTVTLTAGEEKEVPFSIHLSSQTASSGLEKIAIAATSDGVALKQVSIDLKIECGGKLRNAQPSSGIPTKLLGGLNVAQKFLGGRLVSSEGYKPEELIDGKTPNGGGWQRSGEVKSDWATFVVKLAGNEPVPVAGFSLLRLGRSYSQFVNGYPTQVKFSLGETPDTLEEVLGATLAGFPHEQFYELPEKRMAKFARLEIYVWPETTLKVGLGEFKVIADPAFRIDAHNSIASPELGGRVVWSFPPTTNRADYMLDPESRDLFVTAEPGVSPEWIVGFQDSRRAPIQSVALTFPEKNPGSSKASPIVTVYNSLNGASGPWEKAGVIDYKPGRTELSFSKPIWARYLRFEAKQVPKKMTIVLPKLIEVFEAQLPEKIGSVVGEWGHYSAQGPYEQLNPPEFVSGGEALFLQTTNTLLPESEVSGEVMRRKPTHTYSFQVPQGHNYVKFHLTSERALLRVRNAAGEEIAMKRSGSGSTRTYSAYVLEGADLQLEVFEPKRSVVFSWDTSGSVASFRPLIYRTVQKFASQIIPEHEEMNLVPFGNAPLLDDFTGDTETLRTTINSYRSYKDSSDVYAAMLTSLTAAAGRPGNPTIFVITDAVSPIAKRSKFWLSATDLEPRIFAVSVVKSWTSEHPGREVDIMQDLGQSNGGFFEYPRSVASYEDVYNKAACLIRRPVTYRLKAFTEKAEVPGPGLLEVEIDERKIKPEGAIQIILDASGSMLQRQAGKRRINIAKDILARLIKESIPDSIPTGLRVFGHIKPDSCDTELLVAAKAKNQRMLLRSIQEVAAKNLAKTPIADSLEAIAGDMKGVSGPKNVVLITDGEETCEGDPLLAIEKLKTSGINVRVNIVGFAVLDKELQEQFKTWSNAGGGTYFSAQTEKELLEAVSHSLQPQYRVLNSSGKEVAIGTAGAKAIELPVGSYTVSLQQGKGLSKKVEILSTNTQVVKFP